MVEAQNTLNTYLFQLHNFLFHAFLLSLIIFRDVNKLLFAVFLALCNERIDIQTASFSNSSALASNPL